MCASAVLYHVVSTANACDYKVPGCGNADETPKPETTMRGLENPTPRSIQPFPSMKTNPTLGISLAPSLEKKTLSVKETYTASIIKTPENSHQNTEKRLKTQSNKFS